MLASKFLHYVWLSLQHEVDVIAAANSVTVKHVGMRHQALDLPEWVVFYPMGRDDQPSREDDLFCEIMFQLSCHARLAEDHPTADANAPFRLASIFNRALAGKRFDIKAYGAGEAILGGIRLSEGDEHYTPYRNLTFGGEGNFAVENSNVHTVAVTFTAQLRIGG